MHEYEVLRPSVWTSPVEEAVSIIFLMTKVDLSDLYQVADVVGNFVSSRDLLRELPFMQHFFALEENEHTDVALNESQSTSSTDELCILMGCRA